MGRISRLGEYIRQLLIVGAQTVLLRSKGSPMRGSRVCWRRPRLVVAVALANKMARIVWAVMHGQNFIGGVPA